MKISMYEQGGRVDNSFTSPGMTLTGPLLLAGNVTSGLEAVHKQYVDTAVTNINASKINTGTISAARMPEFTGDITVAAGSSTVTLSPTGVVSGVYSKVTVDAKGRVSSGGSLVEADLPQFNWSKIVNGKPTTLAGYGITDALSGVDGIVTGNLILKGNPVANNEAATKDYADSVLGGSGTGISVGDIIERATSGTPTGFLRCNGGTVSKSSYSALYSVIGDNFIYLTTPGNGQPWRKQYEFNTSDNESLSGWTTGTSLPGALTDSQAIVTKNRVYLLGGYNGSGTYISTVYTAPINSDGTLGTWTTGTSLPVALSDSQAIVTKNRVYLLGGYSSSSGYTSTVYTAPINADGTLGTWSTGTSLPAALIKSVAIVTKNRVYLLGGYNGDYTSTVYTAPINSNGTLGTWSTSTSLPGALSESQAIVTKNRVYLLGGWNSGGYISTVYTAPINSDGTLGSWSTSTSLPRALGDSQAIVTKNRVYLLGGYSSSSGYTSTVYTAPINADGALGTWSTGTSLPVALSHSQAIVTKNRVYLLGGYNGGYNSTVYTASFNGGLNDYSPYYDGTIIATDTNSFRLPDYSVYESSNNYYYIKS